MAKTTNNVLMGIGLVILLAMSTFSVLAFVEQLTCKDLYSEQENFGMCGGHKKGSGDGYGGHKKGSGDGYGGHKKGSGDGYGGHKKKKKD